jgi:iron complex transport system ATP-binding protein
VSDTTSSAASAHADSAASAHDDSAAAERTDAAIVEVRDLRVGRSGRSILGPLDLTIRAGERWAVIGPNGSGKTTLLSVLGLTLWPSAGTVEVLGARFGRVDSRVVRRRIGLASSAVEAVMRADLTPVDLVMTARHAATEPWWHEFSDEDRDRARFLLDGLGLGAVADHRFETLSAGERRRTSIARALMPDPELLLLDEPAASLDLGARETLLHDLARLADTERPAAIVLVTHHVEEIPAGFGRAIVLRAGQPVAAGPIDQVLTDAVLSEAFDLPIAVARHSGRAWARMVS